MNEWIVVGVRNTHILFSIQNGKLYFFSIISSNLIAYDLISSFRFYLKRRKWKQQQNQAQKEHLSHLLGIRSCSKDL